MAKKQFGRIAALAALAGAAVGITYFFRYKSFHEELEEDFHDFEDDLDEFDVGDSEEESPQRNYVSLTPEKAAEDTQKTEAEMPGTASADSTEEGSAGKTEEKPKASSENTGYLDSDMEFLDDEPLFSEKSESSASPGAETSATTIVDDEETENQ